MGFTHAARMSEEVGQWWGYQPVLANIRQPRNLFATLPQTKEQAKAALGSMLKNLDWYQFEKLVGLLYTQEGYRVDRKGGAGAERLLSSTEPLLAAVISPS